MARVPMIRQTSYRQAVRPGAVPRLDGGAQEIARGAARVGEAVQRLGDLAAQRDIAAANAQAERRLVDARTAAMKQLNDLQWAFRDDSGFDDVEGRFMDRAAEIRDGLMSGLTTPREQTAFAESFGALAETRRVNVRQNSFQLAASAAQASVAAQIDTATGQMAGADGATRGVLDDQVHASISGLEESGFISPVKAEALRQGWTTQARGAISEGAEVDLLTMIQADPQAALSAIDRSGDLPDKRKLVLKDKAQAEIDRRARAAETLRTKQIAALKPEIDDVVTSLEFGAAVPPEQLAAVRRAATGLAAGDQVARLDRAERLNAFTLQAREQTPAQLRQYLESERRSVERGGGAVDAERIERLEAGERLLGTMEKALATDPLGWGERTGVVDETPINFQGLLQPGDADTKAAVQARIGAAEAVAEQYGTPPRYFRPGEVDDLGRFIDQAPVGQKLTVLSSLTTDFGPQRTNAVLREIAGQDADLGHVAGLAALGGQQMQSAGLILEGRAARKAGNRMDLPAMDMRQIQAAALGDALAGQPKLRGAIVSAAADIYAALAVRQGVTDQFDTDLYRQALRLAAGGGRNGRGEDAGGIGRINGADSMLPSDMSEDDVDAVLARFVVPTRMRADADGKVEVAPADMEARLRAAGGGALPVYSDGSAATAGDVANGEMTPIGDGRYRVKVGGGFLVRDDGAGFYILDLRAAARAVGLTPSQADFEASRGKWLFVDRAGEGQ